MKQRLRRSVEDSLRALATDDAYERYLAHHAQAHAATRRCRDGEFYLGEQQRKWTASRAAADESG